MSIKKNLEDRQNYLNNIWRESLLPKPPKNLSDIELQLYNVARKKVVVKKHKDGGFYADHSNLSEVEHLVLLGELPPSIFYLEKENYLKNTRKKDSSIEEKNESKKNSNEKKSIKIGLDEEIIRAKNDFFYLFPENSTATHYSNYIKSRVKDYLRIKAVDGLAASKGRKMKIGRPIGANSKCHKMVEICAKKCIRNNEPINTENIFKQLENSKEFVEEIDKDPTDKKKWIFYLTDDSSISGKTVINKITAIKKLYT